MKRRCEHRCDRRSRGLRRAAFGVLALGPLATLVACGWNPSRPFERESPEVREAIGHLDGGDANTARDLLQDYLTTGVCKDGNIGTPPRVRERSNGSFDLGLALFRIAEQFGRRFGDEETGHEQGAESADPTQKTARAEQVTCAQRVVGSIADDRSVPLDLRARAYYLQGNLHFLNGNYEDAVSAYDKALEIAPGLTDAGAIGTGDGGPRGPLPDPIGRDAAYNRAIALRRIEDKKNDAGSDAGSDASNDDASNGDGGQNENSDSGSEGNDSGADGGGGGGHDAGNDDAGQNHDAGNEDDAGNDSNKPQAQDAGAEPPPPPSKQSQDERMLDQLENAPTVQQEAARKAGERRRVRGMSDK